MPHLTATILEDPIDIEFSTHADGSPYGITIRDAAGHFLDTTSWLEERLAEYITDNFDPED